MHAFCDRDSRNSLSLSLVGTATFKPLRAQAPLGNWLPPVQFTGDVIGCGGNDVEPFYAVHGSVIPVGPHRGKVLVWDRSASDMCALVNGITGDRDQRWAIVDPETGVAIFERWKIPSSAAPPVHGGPFTYPGTNITITNGDQGLFCAGHCWLPDGTLITVGGDDWFGHVRAPWAKFTGSRLVCIYNPMPAPGHPNGTWSTVAELPVPVPFLTVPRWYPTVVVTYDPSVWPTRRVKVVVLGGIEQIVENVAEVPDGLGVGNGIFLSTDRSYLTHEAYDITEFPAGVWTITKDDRPGGTLPVNYVPNAATNGLFLGPQTSASSPDFLLGYSLFYYARAHYLSNGVFGGGPVSAGGLTWAAGMATGTAWVDHLFPNTWSTPHPIITTSWPLLEEPTGVLLPASLLINGMSSVGEDRIALFGGEYGVDHTGPVTADVHVLDAKAAIPSWSTAAIPPMNHARKFVNIILLPDRSVLVTGGGTKVQHGAAGGEVFTPEVFRGAATGWQDGPPEASPRTYHSVTLLLPSGRPVTMGGDSRTWDMQLFEPHYFQPGNTRPVLTSPASTSPAIIIGYNSTFVVNYTLAPLRTLHSASLTTPGSLTHGHDPNQRLVELGINSSSATTATLTTPVNPTKAPYGYYMLWIVDSAGEVAVAAWVQLL